MAGVPATIIQGSERTQVVILGKPNRRGIIEGVDHQGNIHYRPVRVLNLTSKPSYGWRITGPGYNDVTNPYPKPTSRPFVSFQSRRCTALPIFHL